jgi:hypothetical protein
LTTGLTLNSPYRLRRNNIMKVSIEIDLTPQEARELVGMPNMSAIQDVFVGMAKDKLEKTSSLVDVEPIIKTWTGLGGVAQDAFGAIVGAALRAATEPSLRTSSGRGTADRGSEKSDSATSEKPTGKTGYKAGDKSV